MTSRKITWRVDIDGDAVIVHRNQSHLMTMALDDAASTFVAVQGEQILAKPG